MSDRGRTDHYLARLDELDQSQNMTTDDLRDRIVHRFASTGINDNKLGVLNGIRTTFDVDEIIDDHKDVVEVLPAYILALQRGWRQAQDDRIKPSSELNKMGKILSKEKNGEDTDGDPYFNAYKHLGRALDGLAEPWGLRRTTRIHRNISDQLAGTLSDFNRKYDVLTERELDNVMQGVSEPYAKALGYTLFRTQEPEEVEALATIMAKSANIADNVLDFEEDFHDGLYNVPRQDFEHVKGATLNKDYVDHNRDVELDEEYLGWKMAELDEAYETAARVADELKERYPEDREAIDFVTDLSFSWYRDFQNEYDVDPEKQQQLRDSQEKWWLDVEERLGI